MSNTNSILFVVYRRFFDNTTKNHPVVFDFTDLPGGWKWFGSGPAPAHFGSKYYFEEQFLGCSLSEGKMIEYLNSKFRKLVSVGEIENFTVCRCP